MFTSFSLFVNMRHYGAENFKTLLLLKVTAESIQAEFYSQWLSRNCIWDFEMFSFFYHGTQMGATFSRRYYYKSQPNFFTRPEFM